MTEICIACAADMPAVYAFRDRIFGTELGQIPKRGPSEEPEPLDKQSLRIIIKRDNEVTGLIAVTPPGAHGFSMYKYLQPENVAFLVDGATYEVRGLAVASNRRGTADAMLLMYAAYSLVKSLGGTRIIALGRQQVVATYERVGYRRVGVAIKAGQVECELISATIEEIGESVGNYRRALERTRASISWRLTSPFFA